MHDSSHILINFGKYSEHDFLQDISSPGMVAPSCGLRRLWQQWPQVLQCEFPLLFGLRSSLRPCFTAKRIEQERPPSNSSAVKARGYQETPLESAECDPAGVLHLGVGLPIQPSVHSVCFHRSSRSRSSFSFAECGGRLCRTLPLYTGARSLFQPGDQV